MDQGHGLVQAPGNLQLQYFLDMCDGGFQEGWLSEERVIPTEPDVVACIDA